MAETRKVKRNSRLSQREKERLNSKKQERDESIGSKISRIVIMIVFFVLIVSSLYTIIALS
jgi:hypothetical protein